MRRSGPAAGSRSLPWGRAACRTGRPVLPVHRSDRGTISARAALPDPLPQHFRYRPVHLWRFCHGGRRRHPCQTARTRRSSFPTAPLCPGRSVSCGWFMSDCCWAALALPAAHQFQQLRLPPVVAVPQQRAGRPVPRPVCTAIPAPNPSLKRHTPCRGSPGSSGFVGAPHQS